VDQGFRGCAPYFSGYCAGQSWVVQLQNCPVVLFRQLKLVKTAGVMFGTVARNASPVMAPDRGSWMTGQTT